MEPGCVEEGLSKHSSVVALSHGYTLPGLLLRDPIPASQLCIGMIHGAVGRMKEKRTTEKTQARHNSRSP